MEGGIPPRPRCTGPQCESCRRWYGPGEGPGLFHEELFSGGFVDLADPDPSVIAFEDIAEGLSREGRYTNQCRRPYSVAEHACLVAWRLEKLGASPAVCAAGLHHDDAEALTGDISRPLKKLVPEFKVVEDRVHAAVVAALGISGLPFDDPAVKEADDWAMMQEAYVLMPSRGANWYAADRYPPEASLPWVLGLDHAAAKAAWVLAHDGLMAACRTA